MFLKTFSPSIFVYSFLYASIQLSAASVFNKLDLTTTTTTTILRPLDFVWDYPGEPVPER